MQEEMADAGMKEVYDLNYKTKGVCSKEINFEVKDNMITSVEFVGGCAGNSQGVARLVQGMDVDDAIQRLQGIPCGKRATSCPDQLANALKLYKQSL